jgi:hypothetical protein
MKSAIYQDANPMNRATQSMRAGFHSAFTLLSSAVDRVYHTAFSIRRIASTLVENSYFDGEEHFEQLSKPSLQLLQP